MVHEKAGEEDAGWQQWEACLREGRRATEEGRHDEAAELFGKALEQAEAQAPHTWRVASALYSKAYYHYLTLERLDEAETAFTQALSLYECDESLPEPERVNEIQACLEGLAGTNFKARRSDRAAGYAERILQTSPEFGSRSHAAAQLLNVIARGYLQGGDIQAAEALCRRILPWQEKMYGLGFRLSRLLTVFAAVLRAAGKDQEANELEERIDRIRATSSTREFGRPASGARAPGEPDE